MPTLPYLLYAHRARHSRLAAALSCLFAVCLLAGCAAPRIAGRAESEQRLSPCESAVEAASAGTERAMSADSPITMRYVAAKQAQHDWLDVAVQCPLRFAEGTMRSAQMQYRTQQLARVLGANSKTLTVTRLDSVASVPIGGDALAQAALADDRAGFATEVLAGRFVSGVARDARTTPLAEDGTLLAMSENHKQAASQMMQLSNGARDLRQKLYGTDELLAHSANVTDPVNGLRANTVAVVEMSCAREEMQAIAQSTRTMELPDDANAVQQAQQGLLQLSLLAATHAYTAFNLGYPSSDYAVFAADDDE